VAPRKSPRRASRKAIRSPDVGSERLPPGRSTCRGDVALALGSPERFDPGAYDFRESALQVATSHLRHRGARKCGSPLQMERIEVGAGGSAPSSLHLFEVRPRAAGVDEDGAREIRLLDGRPVAARAGEIASVRSISSRLALRNVRARGRRAGKRPARGSVAVSGPRLRGGAARRSVRCGAASWTASAGARASGRKEDSPRSDGESDGHAVPHLNLRQTRAACHDRILTRCLLRNAKTRSWRPMLS